MRTGELVLVLGGARSGKSRRAEALAAGSGLPVCYVATCPRGIDAEMDARIARHVADRPDWPTLETLDVRDAAVAHPGHVLLVDCLTLWLYGRMEATRDTDALVAELTGQLAAARRDCALVVVSNEVGGGLVPMDATSRWYRDAMGTLHQAVGRAADRVEWMVAGYPVVAKPGGSS